LLLLPTSALAYGLGIDRLRNDLTSTDLNNRGTRVDITSPPQFNILNPNFGLQRVVVQSGFAGQDSGLMQVGFGQFNGVGLDSCIGPNNAGQLKQYWERKVYPSGQYICGMVAGGDIGTETHTYKVQRYVCSSGKCWSALIDGNIVEGITYIGMAEANEVDIGGEITNTTVFNGNTRISAFFGENSGGVQWQRTTDVAGTPTTWITIQNRNDTQNDTNPAGNHEWHLPDAPTPIDICFLNSSSVGPCP
jgi:hypothetical protein